MSGLATTSTLAAPGRWFFALALHAISGIANRRQTGLATVSAVVGIVTGMVGMVIGLWDLLDQ